MSARTYIPQLIRIVRVVCVYTVRYDAQIRSHLPEGAVEPFNAMVAACSALLTAIGDLPILP